MKIRSNILKPNLLCPVCKSKCCHVWRKIVGSLSLKDEISCDECGVCLRPKRKIVSVIGWLSIVVSQLLFFPMVFLLLNRYVIFLSVFFVVIGAFLYLVLLIPLEEVKCSKNFTLTKKSS